ncbi:MAG: lytic murein transglycosylase [Gaiellaceae bacterium]
MKRVALLAAAIAALMSPLVAEGRTFAVVGDVDAIAFPSAETPNLPGSVRVPLALMRQPSAREELSFEDLVSIWKRAGAEYDIPWQVIAAINKVETNYGRNMGPSSAGAVGWMQFLPRTWLRWGVDANGDGIADPWSAADAIYSAARYLAATGGKKELRRAIFAYNHADWYVDQVLDVARVFNPRGLPTGAVLPIRERVFELDPLQVKIDVNERKIERTSRKVARAERRLKELEWAVLDVEGRAGNPNLSSEDFHKTETLARTLKGSVEVSRLELDEARTEQRAQQAVVSALESEASNLTNNQLHAELGLAGQLPKPQTPQAAAVIDYALRQIGVPYTWGGNHGVSVGDMITGEPSLWHGGFDCSSLVSWSFAKGAGIYVGDWTGSQWDFGASAAGATRGKGEARGGSAPDGGYLPGDLLFFNKTDHVGIYLGNDLFIHAPRTGDVVKITRLTDYYKPVWGWVRWTEVSGTASAGGTSIAVEAGGRPSSRVFTIVATS